MATNDGGEGQKDSAECAGGTSPLYEDPPQSPAHEGKILTTSERKALALQRPRKSPSVDTSWFETRREPLRVIRTYNSRRSAKIIIKGALVPPFTMRWCL